MKRYFSHIIITISESCPYAIVGAIQIECLRCMQASILTRVLTTYPINLTVLQLCMYVGEEAVIGFYISRGIYFVCLSNSNHCIIEQLVFRI